MRSGTHPVHQIVGLGKACELAKVALTNGEVERVRGLRDRLWDRLRGEIDQLYLNGSWGHRLPNNLNVSFAFCEGEAMMIAPLLFTLNQFCALGLLGRPRMSPTQAA